MAFSVSPSVIVREVDASQAVPGVATAPAAMAGIFKWGPTNDPILITSENNLADRFGSPTDDNYETFFTAADYLSYSNALYVARADDGSATATGTTLAYHANNDINTADSIYAAFDAKYQGKLGNSIQVSWSTSGAYQSNIAAVGGIEANGIANNSVTQTIGFNSSTFTYELAQASGVPVIPALFAGDVLVIGNSSVGFQELTVSSSTATDIEETTGTGNTAVTTTIGVATEVVLTR